MNSRKLRLAVLIVSCVGTVLSVAAVVLYSGFIYTTHASLEQRPGYLMVLTVFAVAALLFTQRTVNSYRTYRA